MFVPILDSVVREELFVEVTFELRPKKQEGLSRQSTRQKDVFAQEICKTNS